MHWQLSVIGILLIQGGNLGSIICSHSWTFNPHEKKELNGFQYTLLHGVVCTTRGFSSSRISIFTGKRNPAFLPLPSKIEILSIEENQIIFFLFPQGKWVALNNETVGCMENQNFDRTKQWNSGLHGKSQFLSSLSRNPLLTQVHPIALKAPKDLL